MCTVDDCPNPCRSSNSPYCQKHHSRWRRHGDPNVVLKDHTPAKDRWKKQYEVAPGPLPSGCWVWTGPVDKRHGYGFIQDGAAKRYAAHRFVYEQVIGPIPEGLELDHKCRNPGCINPQHMDPVTHAVNVRRGDAGIRNSEKTHCKHGHEFTPENTVTSKKGHRNCRECQRRNVREHMRKRRGSALTGPARPNSAKTHCKHGHEFTPENTIISERGRNCRECSRRHAREWRGRNPS